MADVHTTLWTRRVYASAKGARHLELFLDYTLPCRRRRCLPMYLPPYCPCTVSHLHATISHSRRLSCIACHSFQCSNDFFLLKSSPVLDNIFCTIQIPMLQIPAEFFFPSCMLRSHILFLCISRMWESLFALFFGQRNWKVLLRERNKKLVSNFHLITRNRGSHTYLNDETLV